MRAVEDAIREAENAEWRRTDPETKARAEGLAGQLQDAIAGLEKDLAAAQAAGDAKKIAEAEAALTARRAWLGAGAALGQGSDPSTFRSALRLKCT